MAFLSVVIRLCGIDQIRHRPRALFNPCFHYRCAPERAVHFHEIVWLQSPTSEKEIACSSAPLHARAKGCRLKVECSAVLVSDVGRSRNIRHSRNIPSIVCCTCCDCGGIFRRGGKVPVPSVFKVAPVKTSRRVVTDPNRTWLEPFAIGPFVVFEHPSQLCRSLWDTSAS